MKPCKQNKLNLKGLYNFIILLFLFCELLDNKCRTFNILRWYISGWIWMGLFYTFNLGWVEHRMINVLIQWRKKKITCKMNCCSNNVKLGKDLRKGSETCFRKNFNCISCRHTFNAFFYLEEKKQWTLKNQIIFWLLYEKKS